jgi:hypothetical protein
MVAAVARKQHVLYGVRRWGKCVAFVLPAFYRKVRQLEAQFRTFYFYGKRQAAF